VIRERLNTFSPDEFWQHFNHHLLVAIGVEGDLDQLAAEVTARFDGVELTYHCPEAGCDTLIELRARGYPLGLITNRNNPERFYELLDEMELRGHFDLILASGEVGIRKPEPGIFEIALERMEACAEQTAYIGDNYWADVVGAQRAGVTPVLLDPDRLFPEADCMILDRIDELLAWLT
jgi:putative hydrolase of the HAD superfamily